MTDALFRFAAPEDAPTLVALIERAYRGPETAGSWVSETHLLRGPRTSLAEVQGLIAAPDSKFLVAEVDGRCSGCCLIQKSAATECASGEVGAGGAYFGHFAIDPDVQSSGLGKTVLAEAERQVQLLWGARAMVMTVINLRDQLIAYYQRRGYRLTGATMPFPFREDSGELRRDFHLVEMRKDLA